MLMARAEPARTPCAVPEDDMHEHDLHPTLTAPHPHRLGLMGNILSAFVLGVATLFAFTEGLPRLAGLGTPDLALFVLFVLMLAGLALSWVRTLPGALLTLGA